MISSVKKFDKVTGWLYDVTYQQYSTVQYNTIQYRTITGQVAYGRTDERTSRWRLGYRWYLREIG
jgi:hypothetical protein